MKSSIIGVTAMVIALSTSAFTNSSKLINKQGATYYEYTNINMLAPYSITASDYQYLPMAGCTNDLYVTCKAVWLQPTNVIPIEGSQPTGTYGFMTSTGFFVYP